MENQQIEQDPFQRVKYDGIIYLINEEEKTASVIGCKSSSENEEIMIPSKIKYNSTEFVVTSILKGSFRYSFSPSIQFAEDSELQTIEERSFEFSTIKHITIPSKCVNLQKQWLNLSNIKEIKVSPKNPRYSIYENKFLVGKTTIEQKNYDTLCYCIDDSETITIPSFIEKIEAYAFYKCTKLRNVLFLDDSKLRTIEECSFVECGIENLMIPSNCTEIKEGCFNFNNQIKNIKISPNNQIYKIYDSKLLIGKSKIDKNDYDVLVFCDRDITSIKIPSFIEIISEYAFIMCKNLQKVEFTNDSKLRIIGKNAFSGSNIESIEIPSHVKIIDEKAFSHCRYLQKLDFNDNSELEIIEDQAFRDCSIINYVSLPSKVTKIGESSFFHCIHLKKFEIPENSELQTIGKYSLGSTAITSIYIPSKCTKIEEGWCLYSLDLIDIKINPKNPKYLIYEDRMIIQKSSIDKANYDVLFYYFRNIETINIPSFIEIIGPYAFDGNKNLQDLVFPNDSKIRLIDRSAFSRSSIKSISIPSQVTKLSESSFKECINLQKIEFQKNSQLKEIGEYSFSNGTFESFSIPSHVVKIGNYSFFNCKKLRNVEFPINLKINSIEEQTFSKTLIEKIVIPFNVEIIKKGAFYQCGKLKEVEFPTNSKLKIIENDAFNYTSIEKIVFPSGLKKIGQCAFGMIYKLKTVEFHSNSQLQCIGKQAFYGCSIECIQIPSVIQIDEEAFSSCDKLRIVEIGENFDRNFFTKNIFAKCGVIVMISVKLNSH